MWVHCPRASNGLSPRRSNLVGYVRWDAQSDQFPPCQTIIPTAFRSQSGLPTSTKPLARRTLPRGWNRESLEAADIVWVTEKGDSCDPFTQDDAGRAPASQLFRHHHEQLLAGGKRVREVFW